VLDRLWQYYVAPKLDIPKLLAALAPKDWEDFKATNPKAVEGMSKQLERSTKFHLEGACDGMRLLRNGGDEILQKLDVLRSFKSRVSVFYAKNDTLAPAHHGVYLASVLPEARIFPHEGGHLSMFKEMSPFLDEIYKWD